MGTLDINEDELRRYLESLIMLSTCVQCNRLLTTPVNTCYEGHLLCGTCYPPKCPQCSKMIVKDIILSMVNRWTMRLPQKCEYASRGCNALLLINSKHPDHCPYSYVCEVCNGTGHIVKHFEKNHRECVRDSNIISDYWILEKPKFRNQVEHYLIDGVLFRVSIFLTPTHTITEVHCLRTSEDHNDFMYTMEYKNGEVQFTYTGRALPYKDRDKTENDNENFMIVYNSYLPLLCVEEKLHFTIRITRKLVRKDK